MTTWKILNTERDLATGFVKTVHWACSDVDSSGSKEIYGSVYGSVGLTGELTTPYEQLTEAQVIGWVKEAIGAETVAAHEANVAAQIAAAKAPKTAAGVPW